MNISKNNSAETLLGHLDKFHTNLVTIFYVMFGIIGILGNMSIANIIFSSRVYRRRFSCLFLVNLAIADILVCISATPYYVVSLWMKQQITLDQDPLTSEHNSICKLPMFFNYFTGTLRILCLTLMSIDRYIAINHPYFYAHRCEFEAGKSWGITSIIYVWLQSLVTIIPPMVTSRVMAIVFYGSNGRLCGIVWSKSSSTFILAIMLVNFVLPAVLIVFTNCKVFWLARKHVERERIKNQCLEKSYGVTSSRRISKGAKKKHSIQVAKTKDEESPSAFECKDMVPNDKLYLRMSKTDHSLQKESSAATIYNSTRPSLKDEPRAINKQPSENALPRIRRKTDMTCGKSSTKRKYRISSDWEIALSTLALVVFYFASYLPFMATRLIATSSNKGISIEVVAYTTLLTTLGSTMNPLIVFKTRREFRRILKKKLSRCSNIVHIFNGDGTSSNGVGSP